MFGLDTNINTACSTEETFALNVASEYLKIVTVPGTDNY